MAISVIVRAMVAGLCLVTAFLLFLDLDYALTYVNKPGQSTTTTSPINPGNPSNPVTTTTTTTTTTTITTNATLPPSGPESLDASSEISPGFPPVVPGGVVRLNEGAEETLEAGEEASDDEDYLDFTSRSCALRTNNYTNFCPEAEVEEYLRDMKMRYQELFSLSRKEVYRALAGRIIFIAGDSIAGQHFISLTCILSDDEQHLLEQLGPPWMWRVQWVSRKPLRCAAVHTFTICYLRSATIWSTPWMSDVLALSKRFLSERDILMVNYGLHFTPMGRGGPWPEYPVRTQSLMQEMECATPSFPVYFREVSAQHFKSTKGGWYPGRRILSRADNESYSCHPQLETEEMMIENGYVESSEFAKPNLLNEFSNSKLEKAGVRILPAWDVSKKYWQMHSSYTRLDCTHFCLPGVPDIWSLRFIKDVMSLDADTAAATKRSEEHTREAAFARKEKFETLTSLILNITMMRDEEDNRKGTGKHTCDISKHVDAWKKEHPNITDFALA